MSQSLSRIIIHTIFSTRKRKPYLKDPGVRAATHAFLGGVSGRLGCRPIRIGGVEDHVHLLTILARTRSAAEFVKEVKRVSTPWIRDRGPRSFRWQSGYATFSVSPSKVEEIARYIENQEEHHRTISFQDEFRRILREHGIPFDERYVWD